MYKDKRGKVMSGKRLDLFKHERRQDLKKLIIYDHMKVRHTQLGKGIKKRRKRNDKVFSII